jgi:hypothetical protein
VNSQNSFPDEWGSYFRALCKGDAKVTKSQVRMTLA